MKYNNFIYTFLLPLLLFTHPPLNATEMGTDGFQYLWIDNQSKFNIEVATDARNPKTTGALIGKTMESFAGYDYYFLAEALAPGSKKIMDVKYHCGNSLFSGPFIGYEGAQILIKRSPTTLYESDPYNPSELIKKDYSEATKALILTKETKSKGYCLFPELLIKASITVHTEQIGRYWKNNATGWLITIKDYKPPIKLEKKNNKKNY